MSATADILIVDDDASLRTALGEYLSGAGYAVRVADGEPDPVPVLGEGWGIGGLEPPGDRRDSGHGPDATGPGWLSAPGCSGPARRRRDAR